MAATLCSRDTANSPMPFRQWFSWPCYGILMALSSKGCIITMQIRIYSH